MANASNIPIAVYGHVTNTGHLIRMVKVDVHKNCRVTARRIKREQDRLYGKQ